jgi:hypothetical protein
VTLVPHDLPDYVERGGRQVWRPPYTARHAEVFGFVLEASQPAIDALLTESLVEPSRGAVDYRCASDYIMVTFASIGRLSSDDPVDRRRGYIPERELSIWCLAADMVAGGRLVWYLPYVFTDSGQTVATGREVYGYPKQIGRFEKGYPGTLLAGQTIVLALAIKSYDPDEQADLQPMISAGLRVAAPGKGEPEAIAGHDWEDFSMFDEFTRAFPHELELHATHPVAPVRGRSAAITPRGAAPPPPPGPPQPWVRRVLDFAQGPAQLGEPAGLIIDMINDPTLVFLKQFRDASCATKACYQAIVEAPLDVHPLGATYTALDPDRFEITIADWASHPIASDLGVEPGTALRPERVFRATFGFDIELGYEVWRAPT